MSKTNEAETVKIIGTKVFIEKVLDKLEKSYEILTSSQLKENDRRGEYHRFATIIEFKEGGY